MPGSSPRRTSRPAAVGLALGALLAVAGAPAVRGEATGPGAAAPPHVLLDAGALRTWDGTSTELQPLPKWITVRLGAPLGTLTLREGRLVLILAKAAEETEHHRHKQDGAALLLGWPGGGPADLGFRSQFVVTFEGLPLVAAGTGDHAWVYAHDAAATAPGQTGRAWVHDIDFHAGRVAESTFVQGTVRGLAVEPDGSRLFAGLDDRVLSFTTHPLVTSWHYRSPGPNGPLAISPDGGILAALRGTALALFDAREIAARTPTERRGRADDATRVVLLDRPAHGVAFSDDGRLVAVFGSDRVIYVDPTSGARLGEERSAGLAESVEFRPLRFPGGGSDLVIAALPSGAVAAVPSPEPAAPQAGGPVATVGASAVEPVIPSASPAPVVPAPEPAPTPVPEPAAAAVGETPVPAKPAGTDHVAAAAHADAAATEPAAESAAPSRPPPQPPPAPVASPAPAPTAPAPSEGPPTLSGRIGGEPGIVKGVVIYGPGSIIREYTRAKVGSDGLWSMPLPPPGAYRVVPIGDGSTPIPVRPGFLSITVQAGEPLAGLDFTAGAAN
ncbi:MAG TPA: hypothetical protein VMQ62_07655 [Dongiaceae bacterium]|nr:hypothetical protein [Dongiaceae bacterium]